MFEKLKNWLPFNSFKLNLLHPSGNRIHVRLTLGCTRSFASMINLSGVFCPLGAKSKNTRNYALHDWKFKCR